GGCSWRPLPGLAAVALALGFAVLAFFNPSSHTVYPISAPAARRWWLGEDIYVRLVDYYRYSPLFAILLTPLASLPDCWGGSVWKALNIGVYALGLAAACRHPLPPRLSRNQLPAPWPPAPPPSFHRMYTGQADPTQLGPPPPAPP